MWKKLSILTILVIVLAAAIGVAGAQGGPGGRPGGPGGRGGQGGMFGGEGRGPGGELMQEVISILVEQTGLTPQAIRADLQAGKTPAEIITASGGDVEAVITAIVQAATEKINEAVASGRLTQERADRMLANLEQRVRTLITEGFRRGEERPGLELMQIVVEQTGLDPQAIRDGLQAGQTLAELITENGGDVQAVIDATVQAATERINQAVADGNLTQERADEMLANVETLVTELVNGTGDFAGMGMGPRANRVIDAVAEATGLEPQAVVQQVRAGKTLATILTENNVNVDTFVTDTLAPAKERLDNAVASGRMSQDVADARLNLLRVELLDALNRTIPAAPAGAGS